MIVSITHEHDLDGLGSQAILNRYFSKSNRKESIVDYYANYLDFVGKVTDILKTDSLPSQLIITDIGYNEDFNTLFSSFENARNRGCTIRWFDHHLVRKEIKENLNNKIALYVNDASKCAAEIVKDYYLPDDPVAIKIAEYARDVDFNSNNFQVANELQLIIAYNVGKGKEENKNKIVKLLSEGKFEDKWFKSQLNSLQDWISAESQFALDNVKVVNIRSFGKLAIAFAAMGGGRITRLLFNHFPDIKAAIGIDKRYEEIIIHSEYLNCRNFANKFGGGGHKGRAGFKYNLLFTKENVLNTKFLKEMKKNIPKYID
jgi:oligoribonuclease NrnB/cAMP/cGMP phosphodiesterase (DHH superfamily)